METLKYFHVPGSGAYLGHLFASLTQSGKSESEALKILDRLLVANKTTPPLPRHAKLEWSKRDGLLVVASGGTVYSGNHFYLAAVVLPLEKRIPKIEIALTPKAKTRGRKKRWTITTWSIVGQAFHAEENRNSEGGNLGVVTRLLATYATQWKADGLPFLKVHLLRGKSQLRSNLLQALRRLGYRR